MNRTSGTYGIITKDLIFIGVIEVPEGEEKAGRDEKVLKIIMTENVPI